MARIRLRRRTAADWTSGDEVLLLAEAGYESDTGKLKIGDGATGWNSLPYFAPGSAGAFTDLTDVPASYTGEGGKTVAVKMDETGLEFVTPTAASAVHAAKATLASGSVTVSSTWVTADSVIVVTATAAPGTAGTTLYVDPANIVPGTSFQITSDDVTDARDVFWMATEPTESEEPLTLPVTFYVAFRVRATAVEMESENGAPFFALNAGGETGTVQFWGYNVDLGDSFTRLLIQLEPASLEYDISATPILPDTWVVIDLKFEFSGDFSTVTITPRLDGTELGEGAATGSTGFSSIVNFALGAPDLTGGNNHRDFDYFTIGTTDWGTDDLFSADFATDEAPFDSLVGTGISVGSGMLSVDHDGGAAMYALKASTT